MKYRVRVSREIWEWTTVVVEADHEDAAEKAALDIVQAEIDRGEALACDEGDLHAAVEADEELVGDGEPSAA